MPHFRENQVLAQLPGATLDSLALKLRGEQLTTWQMLRDEHETIKRVYFPTDCVISIVSLMEDGNVAEAYTAGRDGMAGSEGVWGWDRSIFRVMCQIPGHVYSMSLDDFRAFADSDPAVLHAIHAYAHCLMAFTGRSAACNLLHPVVQRCARWLLISHDRVAKDMFELTHDVMATMLGVHRPAVSIAAGTLQKAGLIEYTRGRITVKDRAGLEEASCECYGIIAAEFVRVMGGPIPQRGN